MLAGDLDFQESVVFRSEGLSSTRSDASAVVLPGPLPILQQYGRINLVLGDAGVMAPINEEALSETERLAIDAFRLRTNQTYKATKANRPAQAAPWGGAGDRLPLDKGDGEAHAAAPVGYRLAGRVAVGIIIVSGPGTLAFDRVEQTKIVAEVQNGLAWLSSQSPAKDLTFVPTVHQIDVAVADNPNGGSYEAQEQAWRDAALSRLGHGAGTPGIAQFLNAMRQNTQADYYYCAFFTKYTPFHFAYAHPEHSYIVFNFFNDGWGPDNIDRVFAHESCHIFGAPDEYAAAGCGCGGSWGIFRQPNINCESCAPNGGVPCLMRANTWAMCSATPYHVGYNGLPTV